MSGQQQEFTVQDLNLLNQNDFLNALADVFENSPWIAERTFAHKPFDSVDALHQAMRGVVKAADTQERLQLLKAHPELAGKKARAGDLTRHSENEQSAAGLAHLDESEFERFQYLNTAYGNKFGFPFIIAVRYHNKNSILEAFTQRLENSIEQEFETSLDEVFKITRLRLAEIFQC